MGKSKIQVLEALLRLRQAACHPGLIDAQTVARPERQAGCAAGTIARGPGRGAQGAGVFAVHQPAGDRARAAGCRRGDATNIWTARRATARNAWSGSRTIRDCRLFLISLKAGGVGLNLTAAEYVFLLDPWWNPAVEAQAMDRAHRIGQSRQVFAYRLIARDTVEEKVLELQETQARSGGRDHRRGE